MKETLNTKDETNGDIQNRVQDAGDRDQNARSGTFTPSPCKEDASRSTGQNNSLKSMTNCNMR